MSFLLTLAHFSLPNVKGMSRICKLCLGAKRQVSWIKTLKFYTIPVKMLRDFYRSTSSDVSKYRWYPSYEGRTLITAFDILLGNCTPPHWSEQSLWHTRSCQDFLLLCPQCNAYSLWKEENKKKKNFVKQPSVLYATLLDFSALFLILNPTATIFLGNYILTYILTSQFLTCTQFVKNQLLAGWPFAASIQKCKL